MRRGLGVLAFSVALATNALGQTVMGGGMVSCGDWMSFRDPAQNKLAERYQAEAWVDGFLSGTNLAGTPPDFLASRPSSRGMYAWLDNYCRSNPLDSLV